MRQSARAAVQGFLVITLLLICYSLPVDVSGQAIGSRNLVGGQTVVWNESFLLDRAAGVQREGYEAIALRWEAGSVVVASITAPVTSIEARDTAVAELAAMMPLTTVDRGDYDGIAYSLEVGAADGVPSGTFILAMETPAGVVQTSISAPIDSFQSTMEAAQGSITIDGRPVFNDIDAAAMQTQLAEAAPGSPAPQAATPTAVAPTEPATPAPAEPTIEPTPTPVVAPTEPATPAPAEPTTEATPTPADVTAPAPPSTAASPVATPSTPTAAEPALTNSYVIPATSTTVEWSDDWQLARSEEFSVELHLLGPDDQPQARLVVGTDSFPAGYGATDTRGVAEALTETPDQIIAALDGNERQPATMVLSLNDGATYSIFEIPTPGPTATYSLLQVPATETDRIVDIISDTIRVNGAPVFTDLKRTVPEIFHPDGV